MRYVVIVCYIANGMPIATVVAALQEGRSVLAVDHTGAGIAPVVHAKIPGAEHEAFFVRPPSQ